MKDLLLMFFQKVHNTLVSLAPGFRCFIHSYAHFFGSRRHIVFNIKCNLLLRHSTMSSQADTQLLDSGGYREFSDTQKQFVVENKLAGKKYPSSTRRFEEKYGFGPPSAQHALRLVEKLKKK